MDVFPEFGKFTREDMEMHFAIISQIRRYMTALKKKDFVEFLSSNYPIILDRVSNKLVADFVGITPEWFCKLKKTHSEKPQTFDLKLTGYKSYQLLDEK